MMHKQTRLLSSDNVNAKPTLPSTFLCELAFSKINVKTHAHNLGVVCGLVAFTEVWVISAYSKKIR